MNAKFYSTLFYCSLLLYSCNNHKYSDEITNRSPYLSAVVGNNDNNVFRNVNFGLKQEEVKKAETSKLFDIASDHLFYEITFPDDSSKFQEYADVEYYFNENDVLDIVVTRIYVNDSAQQNQLYTNLQQFYTGKFGASSIDKYDGEYWKGTANTKSKDKNAYHVFLQALPKEFGVSIEYKRKNI